MDKYSYRIHFPNSISKERIIKTYGNVDTDKIISMKYEMFHGQKLCAVEYQYNGRCNYTLYLDEGSYIITPDGKTYGYADFPRLALKLENDKIVQVLDEL